MRFSKRHTDALDFLYGKSTPAMCAVTKTLRLLWSNRFFEQRFLLLVQAAVAVPGHASLKECTEIPLFDGTEYIYCTVETMFLPLPQPQANIASSTPTDITASAADYYLLRFHVEPMRSLTRDAGTELLLHCAGECRVAAEQSLYALNDVHQLVAKNRCSDMSTEAIDQMLAACYRLLNQAVRFEEFAWYNDADMQRIEADDPIALTAFVHTFCRCIDKITGGLLPVICIADHAAIWVKVNTERLMFTLLSLLQTVHMSCTTHCRIVIDCVREKNDAVLSMHAEKIRGKRPSQIHSLRHSNLDETPLSNEALMRRFCQQYNASATLQPGGMGKVYTLRIPLSEQSNIPFESPIQPQDCSRFGMVATMLSSMIDFHHTGGI